MAIMNGIETSSQEDNTAICQISSWMVDGVRLFRERYGERRKEGRFSSMPQCAPADVMTILGAIEVDFIDTFICTFLCRPDGVGQADNTQDTTA